MKSQKGNRKAPFITVMASFLVLLPIAYGLSFFIFGTTYHDVVYRGWHQIELADAGALFIPSEWSYVESDDALIDGFIVEQAAGVVEEDITADEVIFVCYRSADYQIAVREGIVFEDLNTLVNQAEYVSGDFNGGIEWAELEHHDSETGATDTYYEIIIRNNTGYSLISASDSLRTSTVLKMALSFRSYPYSGEY